MAGENFPLKKGIFWPMGQKDGNLWFWSMLEPVVTFLGLKNHTSPNEAFFKFFWQFKNIHFHLCLKVISSFVILVYLVLTAVFVIIDSVATVTFRWKEYGELSFRHTDATPVLFLLSKSRWKLRLLTCLTIASAASLQTTQVD